LKLNHYEQFESLTTPIVVTPEHYGSKLVAATDRQHPRDLFDFFGLFERGGLTAEVADCYVCYIAGHNRPVHEVLFSRDQDMVVSTARRSCSARPFVVQYHQTGLRSKTARITCSQL
jgi:hypothetical protein